MKQFILRWEGEFLDDDNGDSHELTRSWVGNRSRTHTPAKLANCFLAPIIIFKAAQGQDHIDGFLIWNTISMLEKSWKKRSDPILESNLWIWHHQWIFLPTYAKPQFLDLPAIFAVYDASYKNMHLGATFVHCRSFATQQHNLHAAFQLLYRAHHVEITLWKLSIICNFV